MAVHIGRRELIVTFGGAAAAWPLAARAQQGDRMRRIGVLMGRDENDPEVKTIVSAFTQALADLGWTDGRNVRIDGRRAGGDINRIRALAQELVGLQPDIIVTIGTPTTVAVQQETRTIPIVFANVADPVASGIVPRLDRPNGNITGFANFEPSLAGKLLELLSEIAPGLKRAALMFNPNTSPRIGRGTSLETAARSLKVVPIAAPVHSDVEIETAIIGLGREPGGGLVVPSDAFMLRSRPVRQLPSRHYLCRSHSTRREAGRSPGAVSGEIRDGRQPQDRQSAGPHRAALDFGARRRGYRISLGIAAVAHGRSWPKAEICGTAASRRPSEDKRTCAHPSPEGEGLIAGGDPGWGDGGAASSGTSFAAPLSPPPAAQERGDLPPAEPRYSEGSATQQSDRSRQQPTSVGGGDGSHPGRQI